MARRRAGKRVLIVSASVGAGHVRAAEAVELALRAHAAWAEVKNIDVLEWTTRAFRKVYRDTYLDMVSRTPEVFGWLYQATDRPFQRRWVQKGVETANARKFVTLAREFDPDLAVCTHFLPPDLLARERRKGRLRCPVATVVTDFDVHGLWLAAASDHYFVASEEARAHLRSLGVGEGAVTVSGIPTHPVFREQKDRAAVCAKHGLRADLKTILLSTGGFGTGNAGQIVEALLTVKMPLQVIAVCGRNGELREKLERMTAGRAAAALPQVKVLGFTKEMDELMAASDLMMGKPGGLTTWESFQKGLAWAVVNPIPGQEERNTIHLLEEGAGIWCNNLHTMAYKVERLLRDAERLRGMGERSRRLARPDAGRVIAERCLEMI
jgi:processive 1,2-diacylglycerol beta-glucosyltransferase